MYEREMIVQGRHWKKRQSRKPLVIRGARHVDKISLVWAYGREFDMFFIEVILELSEDAEIFRRIPGGVCTNSAYSAKY